MPTSLPENYFKGSAPVAFVIGGAGFVGSHLIEELLSRGVKVICQDYKENSSNIDNLIANENFVFLEHASDTNIFNLIESADYVVFLEEGKNLNIDFLKKVITFSGKKEARFLFGCNFNQKNEALSLVKEQAYTEKADFRIVLWHDLFGPRMRVGEGLVDKTLLSVVKGQAITIPGNQESLLYPVFIKDVVLGLIKALMAPGTRGLVVTFAGEKMSAYNFAQIVKRATGVGVEIEYTEKGSFPNPDEGLILAGRQRLAWLAEASLEEGIKETVAWITKHPSQSSGQAHSSQPNSSGNAHLETPRKVAGKQFWEKQEKKVVASQPRVKKRWFALPLFVLVSIFWLFALPAVQLFIGVLEFNYARGFATKDLEQAKVWFGNSSFWFDLSKQSFLSWGSIPGLKNSALSFSDKGRVFSQTARVAERSTILLQKVNILKANIFAKETYNLDDAISDIQIETNSLERELGFLEAEVSGLDLNLPFVTFQPLVAEDDLKRSREAISFFNQLLPNLPELLGKNSRKVYLVLLQNNLELRPSGGVIKSIAFLTFEKGRLINLEVKDVNTLSTQLKGQIEAPEPLVEHLALDNWDLANSGWSPDFATSANRASWFVEKELEQKTDGVVGFDLDFVKAYLGSLSLELENGEEITSQNLYEKSANPGFATQALRALLKQLTTADPLTSGDLLTILNSAKEKHLSVSVGNQKAQTALVKSGYDGGVRSVTCQAALEFENCFNDYLQVVDANLGKANKNHLIEKSASLEIDIKENVLSHRLTVSLENKDSLGDYKSYLRVLVPATAITTLAAEVNPTSGEQINLEPDEGSDRGKRSYGIYTQIPAGAKRQLVFLWDVPVRIQDASKDGELVFLWQKQAGTRAEPYSLRINLPGENLKVGAYPKPGLTQAGTIGYNGSLSGDLPVNIIWQQK